ncbi:MAG: SDR family oxidoreductase [Oscillospiraceae bacterium]
MTASKNATLVVGADSDMGTAIISGLSGNIIAHVFAAPDKVRDLDTDERKIYSVSGNLATVEGIRDFIAAVKALELNVTKIVHLPCMPAIPTRLKNFDENKFELEINVAFMSAILICREFVPAMAKQRFGRVVFMLTSYCIGVPPKYLTSYVAVKYAVMGLMRSLATEFADKGVTFNGIAPSMTETKFLADIADLTVEASAKNHPMGRNARPADIAPTAWHLLDDDNEYTSGAVIPITGGSQY